MRSRSALRQLARPASWREWSSDIPGVRHRPCRRLAEKDLRVHRDGSGDCRSCEAMARCCRDASSVSAADDIYRPPALKQRRAKCAAAGRQRHATKPDLNRDAIRGSQRASARAESQESGRRFCNRRPHQFHGSNSRKGRSLAQPADLRELGGMMSTLSSLVETAQARTPVAEEQQDRRRDEHRRCRRDDDAEDHRDREARHRAAPRLPSAAGRGRR